MKNPAIHINILTMKFFRTLEVLAIVLTGAGAQISPPMPLNGPDFSPPQTPSKTDAIKQAIKLFEQTLKTAPLDSSNVIGQNLDVKTTTFSFEAWSIHEDPPLYTFHRNAETLPIEPGSVKNVTSETIYRLGSLSKLLTVYTWLAAVGDKDWMRPITDFIPELAADDAKYANDGNDIDHVRWSEITIGSLASHLSGIQKDPALPAALYVPETPIPKLPQSQDIPENAQGLKCPTFSFLACTRETFINSILASHPVYPTGSGPVYSDMASSLLAFALENITGKAFDDSFVDALTKPLDLSATFSQAPKDKSRAFIPVNDTTAAFSISLSYLEPGGGFYSSLNDITKIGRSILTSQLLTKSTTRRWLKPGSFLPDGKSAIGAPWEIFQALGTNKTTWMYSKSGDFGLYSTWLVLLPDYDAGFTILTGGLKAATVSRVLADVAAGFFVPAFEKAAKQEAAARYVGEYAGSFTSVSGNGTDTFEMVVAVDEFAGLAIQNYTINGVDFRAAIAASGNVTSAQIQLRLYPTGLTGKGTDGTLLEGFRMVRYTPRTLATPSKEQVFSSMRGVEWFNIGGATSGTGYGANGGLDEFAFVVGGDKIEITGLQVKTWNRFLVKS